VRVNKILRALQIRIIGDAVHDLLFDFRHLICSFLSLSSPDWAAVRLYVQIGQKPFQ
jgi:hypothetical protein